MYNVDEKVWPHVLDKWGCEQTKSEQTAVTIFKSFI